MYYPWSCESVVAEMELELGSSIFTVVPVAASVAVVPSMAGIGIGGQMAIGGCCWEVEAVDKSADSAL